MTDSRDDASSTRPISVAELLAKNGTIGAPPVGGRRRRRRGNTDAVTVAELTGEIPIITDDTTSTGRVPVQRRQQAPAHEVEELTAEPAPEPAAEPAPEPPVEADEQVAEAEADVEPEPEHEPDAEPAPQPEVVAAPEPVLSEAEADYAAHLEQRNADPNPLDFAAPSRRAQSARFPTTSPSASSTTASAAQPTVFATQGSGAEQMSPDPVVDDDDEMLDLGPDVDFDGVFDKRAVDDDDVDDEDAAVRDAEPSYLRSGADTLFGGQSVADDLARRGTRPASEDVDTGDTATEAEPSAKAAPVAGGSAFVRGLWVVAQCVLAVAFGAGLFIAFDQLWRWNTIVALVLSVLVILGLVVGVRVVRKTEDIGSTLIAVAVGALVTLGPLALLQSH